MTAPLRPVPIPGLFITGTDTDVGKTVVAGAIARSLQQRGLRVAVLKPVVHGWWEFGKTSANFADLIVDP